MITTTNCVLYGLQKTNTYWQTTRPIILQPYFSQSNDYTREQVWRSGESARLPPMWPGFDSRTRRHMWVEFVVGSRPCSEGFSPGTPVFLRPQKPTFANSNSTWNARSPLNEFLESSLVLVDVTLTRILNLTLQNNDACLSLLRLYLTSKALLKLWHGSNILHAAHKPITTLRQLLTSP